MVTIDVTTKGLDKILKTLGKLEDMDFKKPLKKSSKILLAEQQENFDKQGAIYQGGGFVRTGGAFSSGGRTTTRFGPWAPLSPSTRDDRSRQGYNPARPILQRTGKLRKGFRRTTLNTKELEIENKVEYGIYHQTGTKKMPQRRIIGFSRKSITAIKIIFTKHIAGIIKGSLFK